MAITRENILGNIKTVLETIKVANGYNNDINSVQRWRQHGNSLRQVPCVVINAGSEERSPGPNPLVTCKFSVYLDVWVRQDENDANPTDTILNSLLGDVDKALMLDYTRAGYARDTQILSIMPFETTEGQPHAGLTIEVEVHYKYYQNDPQQSG
jgi:hypothetical protein